MSYVMTDGYYWFLESPQSSDWIIVSVESRNDVVGMLSGLTPTTYQVIAFVGGDDEEWLETALKNGSQFDGPIERSAVPGLTSMQLHRAIDNLRQQAKADTNLAEAYELAAEALSMVESLHGK